MDIGFIGLGIMGKPMAAHLVGAGHRLHVHTRSATLPPVAGLNACASGAEVARHAEVIFLMVSDTPDVEEVLFGPDGVAEGLSNGAVVVDMSSISPLATKAFAARIRSLGGEYLDAPVSGGELGAKTASLTIMVGGPQRVFDRVKPLLELLGKNITRIGENGDGQTAKVANQIVVAATIAAVGEALVFAARAGADPEIVRRALMGGFAGSRVLEVHGQRMVDRSFAPGFRIRLHRKDLSIALEAGRALSVKLPQTASAARLMEVCVEQGLADLDHSALYKAVESLSGRAWDEALPASAVPGALRSFAP